MSTDSSTEVVPGPRIGMFGTFDVANYGDLLFPRVLEMEVRRRCPSAVVETYSPYGWQNPVPMDGGRRARPQGAWTPSRTSELADRLDLALIGGGELVHEQDDVYAHYYPGTPDELVTLRPSGFFIDGLGSENEGRCPVVWHCLGIPFELTGSLGDRVRHALTTKRYVAVRDELSAERIRSTGYRGDLAVVPDSVLLLARLLPLDLLARRLRYLRSAGWYPIGRKPIVVQASKWVVEHVDAVEAALREHADTHGPTPIVTVEIGPCHGDNDFADALAERLDGDVYQLPTAATQEDIAAAIAHADCYVGLSLHGSITALAYAVPFVILDLARYTKLEGFARLTGSERLLVRDVTELPRTIELARHPDNRARLPGVLRDLTDRIDGHLDRVVELAMHSWETRPDAMRSLAGLRNEVDEQRLENAALRKGIEELQSQALAERLALVEMLEASDVDGVDALFDLRDRAVRDASRIELLVERVQALEQGHVDSWVSPADHASALATIDRLRVEHHEEHLRFVDARDELAALRGSGAVRASSTLRRLANRVRRRP